MWRPGERRESAVPAHRGVNVIGNAVKIIVEGSVGVYFGSVALVADAAHSVADLVASAVVFVWGGSRYDAADETHPHGHQRIEPLTALLVGATIAVLGLVLLRESIRGLIGAHSPHVRVSSLSARCCSRWPTCTCCTGTRSG